MASIKVKFKTGVEGAFEIPELTITEKHRSIELLVAYDTPGLVAHSMRQNLAWVNSLAEESYLELAGKIGREVFKMATGFGAKDPIAAMRLGPMMTRVQFMYLQMEQESSSSTTGTSSSPTPGPSTGNGTDSPKTPQPAASAPATTPASAP